MVRRRQDGAPGVPKIAEIAEAFRKERRPKWHGRDGRPRRNRGISAFRFVFSWTHFMQRSIVLESLLALAVAGAGAFAACRPRRRSWLHRPCAGRDRASFSPQGGCAGAIVGALGGAKSSVLVQAYSFTNAAIARALVDAHRRGVKAQLILDKSQVTRRNTARRISLSTPASRRGSTPRIPSRITR